MPEIEIDLSFLFAFLQRPDVFLVKAFPYVAWIPIAGVLIWGFFEVWKFNRQHHFRHAMKYILLAIDVPKMTEQSPQAVEQIFASCAAAWGGATFKEQWIDGEVAPVFSFELVSDGGYIQYYVRTPTKFRDMIEAAIYAQYPDAEISEAHDYAHDWPEQYPNDTHDCWGTEQKLSQPYYFPIRTWPEFEHKLSQEIKDPVGIWLEQISRLQPGEVFATQILCMPLGEAKTSWTKKGVEYIYKEIGKESKDAHKKAGILGETLGQLSSLPIEAAQQFGVAMFGGGADAHEEKKEDPWKFLRSTPIDKERLDKVTEKIQKPAMLVKIRHAYVAKKEVYKKGPRDKMIASIMFQYMNPNTNWFGRVGKITPKTDYFWQNWSLEKRKRRLIKSYIHRDEEYGLHGNILNVEELASLWHFPTITILAPFVKKTVAKRAEPPVQLPYEEPGAADFTGAIAGKKPSRLAMPVEFIEPTIPGRPRTASPEAHHDEHGAAVAHQHPESKEHHAEAPRTHERKAAPPIGLPVEPDVAPHVPQTPGHPASVPEHAVPAPKAQAPSHPSATDGIPDEIRRMIDPNFE